MHEYRAICERFVNETMAGFVDDGDSVKKKMVLSFANCEVEIDWVMIVCCHSEEKIVKRNLG